MGRVRSTLVLAAILSAAGCASPVGYRTIHPHDAYLEFTANALSTGRPSAAAMQVLYRLGMAERFESDPEAVLAELRTGLGGPDERSRLFALAELSLTHAEGRGGREHFLMAAAYAWAFLFPPDAPLAGDPFDRRVEVAIDVYNRAVAAGLATGEGAAVDLTTRKVAVPIGTLTIDIDPEGFVYAGRTLGHFVSIRNTRVRGLRNTYRRPGIGAQLMSRFSADTSGTDPWLPPRGSVAVTALLRFHDVRHSIETGHLRGTIALYDFNEATRVHIDGHSVPLEWNPSAALAYSLEGSPIWDFEIAGFRRSDFRLFGDEEDTRLFMRGSYRAGHIPVVFVHGTASSPARWAEMFNELAADIHLAERYQAWFFIYNTGNPVLYSAMKLRRALRRAVADVDPEGTDAALRAMVLVGHSQGGLLTKMMVTKTGTALWDAFTDVPFEQADLTPETRALLDEGVFFEPVSEVARVIFISTPHRGSFLAGNWLGGLARRLVRLPGELSRASLELVQVRPSLPMGRDMGRATSIDFMNPANPTLQALAALPIAPDVGVHSIVAVRGDGPVEAGNDGVVEYRSAHLDEAQSELVVRSGHSCQSRPETIEEVRRILYVHLEASADRLPAIARGH